MKKQQKGITLIALIITIVLLIILAVVSIGAIQDGGLITKAKSATLISQVAQIDEAFKLKMQEEKLSIMSGTLPKTRDVEEIIEKQDFKNYEEWFIFLRYISAYPEYNAVGLKNMYNNVEEKKGELIAEDLAWLSTEIITGGDYFLEQFGALGLTALEINTELGQKGKFEIVADTGFSSELRDAFFIDKNNNVYYVDESGNIVTSSKIYNRNDISFGIEYFNIDLLNDADKKAYQGIYDMAYRATKNDAYASKIAKNDLDYTTLQNTFIFGGYFVNNFIDKTAYNTNRQEIVLTDKDGNELSNMAGLMIEPDKVTGILETPKYWVQYRNEEYFLYIYDKENSKLYDSNNNEIASNVTINSAFELPVSLTIDEGTENEKTYGFLSRFDGRDYMVVQLPNEENVDMNADYEKLLAAAKAKNLSHLNIKTCTFADENLTIRTLKLVNSIETLNAFAIFRIDADDYQGPIFQKIPNLETIELSNSITIIYRHTFEQLTKLNTVVMPDNIKEIKNTAFNGLSNVTVKFKDGKAVSGHPWGGTNITIGTK